MNISLLFLPLVATPFAVPGAELTGTWRVDCDTPRGLQKYTFTLKRDGTSMTGSNLFPESIVKRSPPKAA